MAVSPRAGPGWLQVETWPFLPSSLQAGLSEPAVWRQLGTVTELALSAQGTRPAWNHQAFGPCPHLLCGSEGCPPDIQRLSGTLFMARLGRQ